MIELTVDHPMILAISVLFFFMGLIAVSAVTTGFHCLRFVSREIHRNPSNLPIDRLRTILRFYMVMAVALLGVHGAFFFVLYDLYLSSLVMQ